VIIEDATPEMAKRPQSLRQAAVFGLELGHRDAFLREFLDEFYVEGRAERRAAMLADEPPMTGEDRADAYYTAVAEQLARK
jgi:hypothetical protein